jgi:hypothetical protein
MSVTSSSYQPTREAVFTETVQIGISARFLAAKGEGVHHIAVATPRCAEAVAEQTERGNTLALSGSFSEIDVAFLPTDRDLGMLVEIFSGMPGDDREPDATEVIGGERRAPRPR